MGFVDSRRLTGPNVYFSLVGVVLETRGTVPDAARLRVWQTNVESVALALSWPAPEWVQHMHAKGATLGFTAPFDQLYLATEINEWAWLSACGESEYFAPAHLSSVDVECAMQTIRRISAFEAEPALIAFLAAAKLTAWPVLVDDETLSIGYGSATQQWPRNAPATLSVLQNVAPPRIPVAMVTGSNGKTTSVRLLAAMARAAGLASGHNCTDGLFFNGQLIEADDYSGPAGARATLRHPGVQAAILETARGGLLRRGLACSDADVALVTNISEDHFGEYGVFSLDDLAEVKLSVLRGVKPGGYLVLNAGDPMLVKHGRGKTEQAAWFSDDWLNPDLQRALQIDAPVCAVKAGRLCLQVFGQQHDLGAIADMPLSFGGVARYNIENMAGAALTAFLLGFPILAIMQTLQQFGAQHADNPGRLQSWQFADIRVMMDYAHNPEGMHGFLAIARALKKTGRLAVLLGQAGNREDADIRKLAATVAQARPDFVVLKDMVGYERGRQAGEVPAILHEALQVGGIPESAIAICLDELEAVAKLLAWALPGDVLALPVHGLRERSAVQTLLDAMQTQHWRAGQTLPEMSVLPESHDKA